jgi:hypothetical protein
MLENGKSVILYSQPWNLSFEDKRATRIYELKDAVPIINKMINSNE